jgi:DNA-binding LacI/PurR family transcriptional regulator
VAFFHGPREYEFTRRYLEGYQLIVDRFNFDADERLLVETGRSGMERGDKGFVPTEEELESLQQVMVSPHRPTAFILPTWNMSVQVLDMARSLNLRVPQDFSVISMAGPSDEESPAAQLPRITRMHLDNREAGRRAAEILLNLIAGNPCPKVTSLKTELLVQETTGPVPCK